MRFFRSRANVTSSSADRRSTAPVLVEPEGVIESETGAVRSDEGHSDVFMVRRSSPDLAPDGVTLFVYGWENVQPGPLSWVFPNLGTALDAVRTMRNAIAWCIVAGREWTSIDSARAEGAVLIEQSS